MALSKVFKYAITIMLILIFTSFLIIWSLRKQSISITPLMVINQKESKVAPMRKWMPLDSISPEVIRAVIACEDNNFFYHYGFDIEAIKVALKRNEQGDRVYGASTITQQTAKNVFLSPNRTWIRKGAELALSIVIEKLWGKERIMEVYLNIIEMGPDIYGIEAAAKHYFGKRAYDLDLNEATLIAIALPNPKKLNPAKPGNYMLTRQEQVLDIIQKMTETGWYKNVKNLKQIQVNYLDQ